MLNKTSPSSTSRTSESESDNDATQVPSTSTAQINANTMTLHHTEGRPVKVQQEVLYSTRWEVPPPGQDKGHWTSPSNLNKRKLNALFERPLIPAYHLYIPSNSASELNPFNPLQSSTTKKSDNEPLSMAFQELLSSNNKKAIERFQGWKKEHHIRMTDIYKGIAKIINNEKSDSQIFNSLRNWAAGRLPLPNHYVLPMMEFFKEKSVDLDKDLTKEFGLHSDTSTVQSAKIRRFLQQSDSHTILGTERKLAEILGKNENSIRKLWKGKTRDLRYPLSKYEANEIKKTFPDDSWDAKLSEDMENPPKRARKKE